MFIMKSGVRKVLYVILKVINVYNFYIQNMSKNWEKRILYLQR